MSRRPGGQPALRWLAWVGLLGLAALGARAAASSAARPADTPPTRDPNGAAAVSQTATNPHPHHHADTAPGEEGASSEGVFAGLKGYSIGLGFAVLLTVASFSLPGNALVWGPAIPAALIVFAIAQMGVHLVFFLHITTGPDNLNNVMALAFGLLIVLLVIGGSLWIMAHLDANMAPMDQMMQMQR